MSRDRAVVCEMLFGKFRRWWWCPLFGVVYGRSVVELLQSGRHRRSVVASVPVVSQEGREVGILEVEEGDEAADAVGAFCFEHDLPSWFQRAMIDSVCASYASCGRKRTLVFEAPVMSPNGDLELPPGPFQLWNDEDPIAAMESFLSKAEQLVKKNRTTWESHQKSLLSQVKKQEEVAAEHEGSARGKPKRDAALQRIEELEKLLQTHALIDPPRFLVVTWFRDRLVEHVCALRGVRCATGKRPLPDIPISLDGSAAPLGIVRAYEGDEVADVAYQFAATHKMLENDIFRKSLRDYLCANPALSCSRTRAIRFSKPSADILGNPGLSNLPNFEVWEDEEPADVAFAYAKTYSLSQANRYALLAAACAAVECERGHAAVFKFPVNEGGESKGDIILYEDQLPADAVYDFCRKEKYLQPKYTEMGVRETLHGDFCRAYNDSHRTSFGGQPIHQDAQASCDGGPGAAREKLTTIEFTVHNLPFEFRFYDDDFPPTCPTPHPPPFSANSSSSIFAVVTSDCVEERQWHAAAAMCGRIHPYPAGCEAALGPAIAQKVLRAERRRYEIVTPFGYDYYLPLRELRDASNQTVIRAYLRELGKLPHILVDTNANASRLNRSLSDSVRPTAQAARASLAAVRGQRFVLEETLRDARRDLEGMVDGHLKRDGDHLAARASSLVLRLAATTTLLEGIASDLDRARALLKENSEVLRMTDELFNQTRPQANQLETKSRVLKEAYETLSDKKKRESHDKPCEKIFGACCAKETPNGGKDIKCGGDATDF